jgi:hypothetical protein
MGSRTEKQRQAEEAIKKKIVAAHRAGLTDKNGVKVVPAIRGTGHTNRMVNPWGKEKYNIWPRDENGELI